MLPPIPTDIYEDIIDQADYATLKNCALLCRALRAPCQRILFSRIILNSPPHIRHLRSATFYDLISKSSHLCLYVKALEISELDQPTWIAIDIYLGRILPKLLHLNELAIVGRISQWGRLSFEMMTDALRAAILSICRSPQLSTLELTNTRDIPLDMLRQASGLKSLILNFCSLNYGSTRSVVGDTMIPILRNLALVRWRSISEWLHFFEWMQDGDLDVTQLAGLRLDITALNHPLLPLVSQGLDELKLFIEECSPTLESFELLCPESAVIWSSYDLLDLANMPRLRTLVLYGHIWSKEMPENSGLQWHIDALRKIPSRRRFEAISLRYNIEDDVSIESSGFAENTNWSGFVAVVEGLHERTLKLDTTFHVNNSRGSYVHDIIQDKLAPLVLLEVLSVKQTMITTDLVLFGA